jgi:fatty acid CoA ligase FadD9
MGGGRKFPRIFLKKRTGFYSGDMNFLMEDIAILRPSELSAPPRFWNMLYSQYKKAVAVAMVTEKEVKKEFSLVLGNRVRSLSTGGAPTSPAVLAFLRDCFQHTIVSVGYVNIVRGLF